ncbi:ComEC/Rec2 family competence protein [Sphingomonas faeni]|uniref:ComEC/Rec2 family competence protein n=1 Tax=Sphingomonas faeni TaxID=185950 RepID=UPI00334A70AB
MGVPRWGAVVGLAVERGGLAVERWLEAERDQLVLWLPVILGGGIALWFALPDPAAWSVTILLLVASGLACLALGQGGRAARSLAIGLLATGLGLGLIWARSESVARPVLGGPTIASFSGKVEAIEPLVARKLVRLTLLPVGKGVETDGQPVALPYRVRVNLAEADAPKLLGTGALVHLRARLMPPPLPAVPGAYDFARVAWFGGIGATGRGFAPVVVTTASDAGAGIRVALSHHIVSRLEGSAGGIAAALATGDVGAISEEDSEAMRRAGLAHLLSVSGLHITAAVAATMLIVLRLLALSPWLALHARLPLIAALAGAAAAIGYTLLTGSQVPTIRSCVAALLVLAALAMGREAMTLRLVAAGAACVMLVLPESAAGPSFQLSFAAITAIMALHEHPVIHAFFGPHEEGPGRKLARSVASLLLTGLLVELALMPIAVYHFHRAGLYGAFANIIAIPLTTFVVMPLEALALLLDAGGLGAPIWWLVQRSLDALLWLAHIVASAPGSVRSLPAMPTAAFALMIVGGIWIALWRTQWRRLGLAPLMVGAIWALTTPAPDVLVTGDGRHVAVRTSAGLAMLRDRAGDYTRDTLAENGGVDGEPLLLADQPDARCSRDLCVTDIAARGRMWRILATRSAYMVPITEFIAACRSADVVVSERGLPKRCAPRWLKLDRRVLRRTGGVALTLGSGTIVTILNAGDRHPWRDPPLLERTAQSLGPRHDRFHDAASAFRATRGGRK